MIATAQWVLPQVDIYIGELSPFGASISFTACSSRSNASGRRIYRHSKPNGGPTFGVVDESTEEDEETHAERDEVQVKVRRRLHEKLIIVATFTVTDNQCVSFTFLLSNSSGSNIETHGVPPAEQRASSRGYLIRPIMRRRRPGNVSVHVPDTEHYSSSFGIMCPSKNIHAPTHMPFNPPTAVSPQSAAVVMLPRAHHGT